MKRLAPGMLWSAAWQCRNRNWREPYEFVPSLFPGRSLGLFCWLIFTKSITGGGGGAFLDSGKVMGAMEQYWATFISVEQRRGIGGRRNSGYKSLFASTTHPPSHLVTFLLGIILSLQFLLPLQWQQMDLQLLCVLFFLASRNSRKLYWPTVQHHSLWQYTECLPLWYGWGGTFPQSSWRVE